jgi:hypothetical protein
MTCAQDYGWCGIEQCKLAMNGGQALLSMAQHDSSCHGLWWQPCKVAASPRSMQVVCGVSQSAMVGPPQTVLVGIGSWCVLMPPMGMSPAVL